jgi:hypothetical protein
MTPKEKRYADWLASQTDDALLKVRDSLTGEMRSDIENEIRRRGID